MTIQKKCSLYGWGQGAFGKLGIGSDKSQFDPVFVSKLEGVELKDLSTGKTVTVCIDSEGNLLSWGKPINVARRD